MKPANGLNNKLFPPSESTRDPQQLQLISMEISKGKQLRKEKTSSPQGSPSQHPTQNPTNLEQKAKTILAKHIFKQKLLLNIQTNKTFKSKIKPTTTNIKKHLLKTPRRPTAATVGFFLLGVRTLLIRVPSSGMMPPPQLPGW